jgi:branched-chain amino acid transport system substrate-binding protein
MLRRAFLLSSLAVALSGCAESGGYYPSAGTGYGFSNVPLGQPESLMPGNLPPGAGRGGRVAILLPLSGSLASVGQAMLQAAQLAFATSGAPELDVKDTGGTPQGAAAAAHAAVTDGAGIILGPLTSGETAAVAPIARSANIAVLAFTNDPAQAQPGVWTLGITPVQQVRRLVAAVQAQGRTQFAALLPDSQFGQVMGQALSQATNAAGLPAPDIHFHGAGMGSITTAVKSMSGYATRRAGIDAKIKADKERDTPEARQEARELARTPVPPPTFNVLLLADTDDALEEIAALLPYYYVDTSQVQVLGPALWASRASGSGHMPGAWYAAPDPAARAGLVEAYTEKYGTEPPQLANLAFDAASIARVLGAGEGYSAGALTREAGFLGTNGWLALLPDGHVRRGLAVFRIESGGPQMIEPAPQSGSGPGT